MHRHETTARGHWIARVAATGFGAAGLLTWGVGAAASAATHHGTKGVVVAAVKNSKLGTILVSGNTLYTLKPSRTACDAKCLKYWPELTLPKGVTKATAGKGVSAAKLGTIKRANGVLQVTYAGQPLYWFSKDTGHGQAKGNLTDTWGKWSTVATVRASGGGTATTSPGTGGIAF